MPVILTCGNCCSCHSCPFACVPVILQHLGFVHRNTQNFRDLLWLWHWDLEVNHLSFSLSQCTIQPEASRSKRLIMEWQASSRVSTIKIYQDCPHLTSMFRPTRNLLHTCNYKHPHHPHHHHHQHQHHHHHHHHHQHQHHHHHHVHHHHIIITITTTITITIIIAITITIIITIIIIPYEDKLMLLSDSA